MSRLIAIIRLWRLYRHESNSLQGLGMYTAFLYLQSAFVIFWRKNIGTKAVCKMLVKLTAGCQLGKNTLWLWTKNYSRSVGIMLLMCDFIYFRHLFISGWRIRGYEIKTLLTYKRKCCQIIISWQIQLNLLQSRLKHVFSIWIN